MKVLEILPQLKSLNGRDRNFAIVETDDEEDEDDLEAIDSRTTNEPSEQNDFDPSEQYTDFPED